tara:strand:+ start:1274 stop:1822 length:549 start_codon:yes stop_codon:yes gene_type:complete
MTLISKLHEYATAGLDNRFWYEESNRNAAEFCRKHNIPITDFVAVLAILSPRVQVSRSIRLAKQYVLENDTRGIMQQRIRALDIWRATGNVSGVKINSFFDSLMLKGGTVCVDIHMSRLFGFDERLMSTTKHWTKKREQVKRVVRKLAKRWNVTSYQMQAILWCGYLKTDAPRKNGFEAMTF